MTMDCSLFEEAGALSCVLITADLMVHACALNPTAAQTNVERVRLFFVLLSRVAHRHAAALCHDPGRLTGAALDIAAAAAERRRADRDGCTLGRNRPRHASSNVQVRLPRLVSTL